MLHITLSDRKPADPDDALGRSEVGYDPAESEAWNHEANRGCWVLGKKADDQQYAVFSHRGQIVQAMEITGIVQAGSRRALVGDVLKKGHPVYDKYVGGPKLATSGSSNPIEYISSPFDQRACACGCGTQITKGDWVAGHDQRALHARIAKVGTVREFIEWFDRTWAGE